MHCSFVSGLKLYVFISLSGLSVVQLVRKFRHRVSICMVLDVIVRLMKKKSQIMTVIAVTV